MQFTVVVVVFCFWLFGFFLLVRFGAEMQHKQKKLTTIELDSLNLLLPLLWLKSKLYLLLRSLLRNA